MSVMSVPEGLLFEVPPQPLDQVQIGGVGRQIVQPGAATLTGQPLTNHCGSIIRGVVQNDVHRRGHRMPLLQVLEQRDHLGGGDLTGLAANNLTPRPTQRAIERHVGAAMIALQRARLALADPAAGRMRVIGWVGCIHEVERLDRVGGGPAPSAVPTSAQERPAGQPGPPWREHASAASRRNSIVSTVWPSRAACRSGQTDGPRSRRPLWRSCRAVHQARLPTQRAAPCSAQARCPHTPDVRSAPTVGDISAVMIPYRLRLDEQRLGYPLSRPAIVQQQQSIHPTMHCTVQLPPHQRQKIRRSPALNTKPAMPAANRTNPRRRNTLATETSGVGFTNRPG